MSQQQQNIWLQSFGICGQVITKPTRAELIKGKCSFYNDASGSNELRAHIKEKIEAGCVIRGDAYKALLKEGKIPENDGKPIAVRSFGIRFTKVMKELGKSKPKDKPAEHTNARKMIDLFDSGMKEIDIIKIHGYSRSQVYTTLLRYGRVKKRSFSNSLRVDELKIPKITKMILDNVNKKEISKRVCVTLRYVEQIIREREKAFRLLSSGEVKTAVSLGQAISVSNVYAESLVREFMERKNEPASTRPV